MATIFTDFDQSIIWRHEQVAARVIVALKRGALMRVIVKQLWMPGNRF